ncbi:acyl-CoA/acyl-ACP dehydrogenase [Streptomyces sp. NBC_01221]|uniref:acyl-CoA dehydrogenase family protein n=1 Tax=unclassified Streptomyces TaxID=2593676 RepID=UPI002255BA83|nr:MULTISPECIES: acyl-CoA dehydrogenase family protein [unclassified Streptomyces]MCX4790885.1 acyl-CoA/acyl-ACP dehydrogenase [Streptomyces sp. NBC_01221]MCX4793385.1 acyl-CoA/acyl-ACP dehydrogenase [Streptomyces sp. NBC_01242]WSP59142.1 acyl-CoA/acyl-ACP dehydrogenase [Streptomyces sp. NBC_01241]
MRLTEEQEELRSAVRSLLARHEGAAAWRPLTGQIGVAGLAVPEEYGGAGCGAAEVHVVMEELGRELSPVPCLGSAVLTVQALLASGDGAACARLLPRLAEGRTVGTLAWAEQGSWDPAAIRAEAVAGPGGGAWRITGTKEHVLDGTEADVLLVAARTAAGVSLLEVAPDGVGVRREAVVTMDLTRSQARVVLDGAEGRLIGADGEGDRVLRHVLDLACAALAAEQVGAAERCLELTVAYAKDRVQFGRPIGSFQAVKHRLADAYVLVESARSAALGAALAAVEGSPELSRSAAVAKSACSEAFSAVAGEMIQLHGGIGITWEHTAHRYFKRAHGSGRLFGPPSWHRGRLATGLGLTAA